MGNKNSKRNGNNNAQIYNLDPEIVDVFNEYCQKKDYYPIHKYLTDNIAKKTEMLTYLIENGIDVIYRYESTYNPVIKYIFATFPLSDEELLEMNKKLYIQFLLQKCVSKYKKNDYDIYDTQKVYKGIIELCNLLFIKNFVYNKDECANIIETLEHFGKIKHLKSQLLMFKPPPEYVKN